MDRLDPMNAHLPAVVIGDVHGCLDEAGELLDLLSERGLDRKSQLVLVGDLVDKGPDAVGVVRLFRELRDDGWTIVLCEGNHEEKHARWRRNERRREETDEANPMDDPSGVLAATFAALQPEDVAFLESAVLYHALPWADALVVHGGIAPDLESLPTPAELADMSSRARSRVRRMLRLRYWNPVAKEGRGSFVPLGEEDLDRDVWWAELYDGRFGHVLFGHEPFLVAEPPRWPHATGLDLGCAQGGRLAAAIVRGRSDFEFVSVPARRSYCGVHVGGETRGDLGSGDREASGSFGRGGRSDD